MRRLVILVAFGLVAAACGGTGASVPFESSATTGDTMGTTTTAPPTAPTELPDSDYPDVVVADLAGGEVNLRELALESEPVLLWFWAPH